MDLLALLLSLALPWGAGCVLLALARRPARASATTATLPIAGQTALLAGYGYFAGLLVLTLWMRLLSLIGVAFGRLSIGLPLAILVVAGVAYAVRARHISMPRLRASANAILQPPWPRWQRVLWLVVLACLALRFVSLVAEIASRPLYPWDAWTQWAPKARVWSALGRMVAFVPGGEWLAGTDAYFDAAPGNPATIPLLQAWGAIALGRWDDSAISWPWLFMLIALALAVYGTLRDRGVHSLGALTGAYLVASLPLADTHAALAGYADLMLAGLYTLAALALHRWALHRTPVDGAIAILLAAACPFVDVSGRVWAAMLVSGLVVALLPSRGLKIVGWAWAVAALGLVVFSRETPWLGGLALHPTLPWRLLGEAFFLFDNWHLLWYVAIALAIVGARKLVAEPLAALTAIVASSVAWLLVAALFSADVARWFPVAAVINRAALHVAPLVVVLSVLLWRELTASHEETRTDVAVTHA